MIMIDVFFVTRYDWTKEFADSLKIEGYFTKLYNYYSDQKRLNGLYYYLLNHVDIKTNMKGDAVMTSIKQIMMNSEPNDEQ